LARSIDEHAHMTGQILGSRHWIDGKHNTLRTLGFRVFRCEAARIGMNQVDGHLDHAEFAHFTNSDVR
jgi:hypothetical protein